MIVDACEAMALKGKQIIRGKFRDIVGCCLCPMAAVAAVWEIDHPESRKLHTVDIAMQALDASECEVMAFVNAFDSGEMPGNPWYPGTGEYNDWIIFALECRRWIFPENY